MAEGIEADERRRGMTREEAIDYNKNLRMYMKLSDKNQPCKFLEENYIALDMAIKALEPVTPQPKMGHWIETANEYYKAINEKGGGVNENTPYFTDDIACSECLAKFSVIDNETERFICCPNCGAKMVESQERED